MKLREWQSEFQNLILNPVMSPKQADHHNEVQLDFLQKDKVRSQRLKIYQNAYQQRLSEALRTNFPAVHQLLGDEDFSDAAKSFISMSPPKTASIRWFGIGFSGFLERHEPYNSCPAIAELAQFEWAMRHAIDAKDADRVKVKQLEDISPEQWADMSFTLHPSVTVLKLEWNAVQVWQALDNNNAPPQPAESPATWLIYRKDNLMNAWRSSETLEAQSLGLITNGKSFGDLCGYLLDYYQDSQKAISQAALWLKTWIEQGLLVKPDSLREDGGM